jgi:predicted Zn-dependent protease
LARWWGAPGDPARALAIAEAVTLLHPADPGAWLCKAEAARAAGRPEEAALATAEAAALEVAPVPFAVPGVARG